MAISKRATPLAFATCFSLAFAASAQQLSFGVVGGTNLTSNFPTTDVTMPADMFGNPASRFQYLTGPRSFIFGALVEIRLSERFSIEVNVLHRPMKSTIIFTEFLPDSSNRGSSDSFTAVLAC